MRKNEMGSFKATRVFNLPQRILECYIKNADKLPADVVRTKIGRKPVLPPTVETDLAEYCLIMEQRFFSLMQKEVRRMANQLAVGNEMANPFLKDNEQAGKTRVKNFLKTNSQLAVRTPQGSSFEREKNFTPEAVSRFFDIFGL
jgi:hypothetical protein